MNPAPRGSRSPTRSHQNQRNSRFSYGKRVARDESDRRLTVIPTPTPVKDRTARTVGRYVTIEEIGAGGFGTVWRAWDTQLSRTVALKLLRGRHEADIARFRREARLAAGLSHPNIAAVYEVGDDPPFIAMQFIDGRSADAVGATLAEALRIVRHAAEAVDEAHRAGIVHRDLKPENIMVDRQGRVFVMDFGLARPTEGGGPQTTELVGTPPYMSPEQVEGGLLDARSDVYSLGATLYSLIAGRPPFAGSIGEILRAILNRDPDRLPVPSEAWTIVARCMEKDPARRYPSAGELARDIERYLAGEPIHARPPTLAYRLAKRLRRNARVVAAAALAVAAVAGLLLPAWWSAEREVRRLADDEQIRAAQRDCVAALRVRLEEASRRDNPGPACDSIASELEALAPAIPEVDILLGDALSMHPLVIQERARFEKAAAAYDRALADGQRRVAALQGRRQLRLRRVLFHLSVTQLTYGTVQYGEAEMGEDLREAGSLAAEALARGDFAEADRLAGESMEAMPETARLLRACARIGAHDYEGAMNDADAATELRPCSVEATFIKAVAAFVRMDHEAVERILPRLRELAPDALPTLVTEALLSVVFDRFDRLPPLLERLATAAEPPEVARAAAAFGWTAIGDFARARVEIELAGSDRPFVLGVRAALRESEGDATGASEDLRRIGDPRAASPLVLIGLLHWYRGDLDRAEACCTRVIEAADGNALAWAARAIVRFSRGDALAAAMDAARAAQLDPGFIALTTQHRQPAAHIALQRAVTAYRAGESADRRGEDPSEHFRRAYAIIEEALAGSPTPHESARLLRNRGAMKLNRAGVLNERNLDDAELLDGSTADYDRAQALHPYSFNAESFECRSHARFLRAAAEWKKARALSPALNESIRDAEAALELEPKRLKSRMLLGRAHWYDAFIAARQGRDPEASATRAIEAVDRLPETFADARERWLLRARSCVYLSRWEEADAGFGRAVESDPACRERIQAEWDEAKRRLGEK